MSDEGNSIDNLSARVRILAACRNELVAKIARDVRAMRATVHAKVAEGAEDASVAAEDQGKQGNKKNAATLAARLDGYSTAQLVDFLAALKVHVVTAEAGLTAQARSSSSRTTPQLRTSRCGGLLV